MKYSLIIDQVNISLPCFYNAGRQIVRHVRIYVTALEYPESIICNFPGCLTAFSLVSGEIEKLVRLMFIGRRLRFKHLVPKRRDNQLCIHNEFFQHISHFFLHGGLRRRVAVFDNVAIRCYHNLMKAILQVFNLSLVQRAVRRHQDDDLRPIAAVFFKGVWLQHTFNRIVTFSNIHKLLTRLIITSK